MVRSIPPPSMPAAANAAVMLVEQASTTENAGTLGLSLASSQISRAILLQPRLGIRSEEHTSELQSLMRISYAVFCLKNKKQDTHTKTTYDSSRNKTQHR